MIIYGKELYHYGIKGQKHGIRNYQNEDGSYTSKGQQENNGHGRYSKATDFRNDSKFKLTDKQKKYIKIGAAIVAGVAIVGISAYSIKSGKLNSLIDKGKAFTTDELKEMGIHIVEPDYAKINYLEPNVGGSSINPLFNTKPEYMFNCGNSVLADIARDKGIDAYAIGNSKGLSVPQFLSFFNENKSKDIIQPSISDNAKSFKECLTKSDFIERGTQLYNNLSDSIIKNFKDGSKGAIFIPNRKGSHWMKFEIDNKEINFKDSQGGILGNKNEFIKWLSSYYESYSNPESTLTCINLTNNSFNDNIKEAISIGKFDKDRVMDINKITGNNFIIK